MEEYILLPVYVDWTHLVWILCGIYFLVSFQIPHGAIDHKFSNSIPQEVLSFDKAVDGLSITNSYGLFRRFVRNVCIVW